MVARTFVTRIVTRNGELFAGEAVSAIVPGDEGYFGVLANHAPLMSVMDIGEALITTASGEERYFAIIGGIAEVRDNVLVLLADIGEQAVDIDVARAEAAAQRARERLFRQVPEEKVEISRAELALARALNRLRVARRAG